MQTLVASLVLPFCTNLGSLAMAVPELYAENRADGMSQLEKVAGAKIHAWVSIHWCAWKIRKDPEAIKNLSFEFSNVASELAEHVMKVDYDVLAKLDEDVAARMWRVVYSFRLTTQLYAYRWSFFGEVPVDLVQAMDNAMCLLEVVMDYRGLDEETAILLASYTSWVMVRHDIGLAITDIRIGLNNGDISVSRAVKALVTVYDMCPVSIMRWCFESNEAQVAGI